MIEERVISLFECRSVRIIGRIWSGNFLRNSNVRRNFLYPKTSLVDGDLDSDSDVVAHVHSKPFSLHTLPLVITGRIMCPGGKPVT